MNQDTICLIDTSQRHNSIHSDQTVSHNELAV